MKKTQATKSLLFFVIFTLLFLGSAFNFVSPIYAQGTKEWTQRTGLACTGGNAFEGRVDATDVATIQGFGCLIANILSVAITIIGLIAFVMFIIASFRLLLKPGDSKSKEMAKSTVTYAVAGIVVALSAFIILNLISKFTGVDVTNFVIPNAGVRL